MVEMKKIKKYTGGIMIKLLLLLFLISCKSKTIISLNENQQHIKTIQSQVLEIKQEAKSCNNETLDLKINILEKEVDLLKISNEKAIIEYKAEIKEYKVYKNIIICCFLIICLYYGSKITLFKLK